MGNGAPVVTPAALVAVPASPARLAPRSSPYHSFLPCTVTGPCQILAMTAASAG